MIGFVNAVFSALIYEIGGLDCNQLKAFTSLIEPASLLKFEIDYQSFELRRARTG